MFLTNIFIFTFITLTAGKDYYELLGVSKDADNREIRRAFKKLAVSLHPDKNMDDPNAHEVFVKLTRAYEVLKDPQLRKHYDVHGEEQTDSSWKNSQYHSYTYYRDHFGIYDDDPEIITLSSTDFESYVINSDKQWFVNYYSPLCSHCHELAPTWRKLAVELKDIVMFAAVNCEEEWNLCRQQNIRAYPSLILYPSVERFTGSRNREDLNRFILDRAEVDIRHVRSTDDWTKLTEKSDYPSWLLLLCNSNVLPDCPHGDMRTKLAAILNGLVGVAVVDCTSLDVCSELVQDLSSVVYWSKTQHGISSFTLTSEYPVEMAKEVFDFMPDLIQLNTESFNDMITKLELGSQTPWLVYFHIGSYDELDNEVKKLAPLLMPEISVGRVNCGRFQSICSDVSVSRYPSFAVFKPGGGHEFHHGTVSVYSIVQFARESAAATNLRTLTQHLFPQLVMAQDGSTAWFVDFYAPWCPPCLRLLPELRKASRTFDTVRFGTVDCTIHSALCKQHNIQAYPTTILFNHSQPTQFFRGEHSASSIVDFIQDILNPSVIKLTEETFYTTLGRKSPDSVWIVDYFMPWCGPCQQLAPQWRKLAKMVSDIPNVYVAEVNCETENSLCRQQGVQSYPSIRLYPLRSSGLNTVALYSGYHRDARSLRQWLFSFLPSSVVELTPDSFSQVLQGKDYWLIDFYAPWCGHCHAFEPEFKTVAQNVADIKKLKSSGICTVKGIQMCTRKKLCNIKGFSEAKVDKIKEACSKLTENGFLTALQVSEKRKNIFKVSTGSDELDKLLGGGVESMSITEAFGEFRTGKTQLSHTLCVTAQIPDESGYTGGKVIFLDTENTFRPDRLRTIAQRFNLDQNAVLDNILYARAYTSEHQYELLDYVAAKFHEEGGVFKLLIVDSIMALFRVDFSGRGELADRQQKLAQMLSRLQKVSEEYNVAVFITNQMTADPGAALSFQVDPKKPIGGNILAHASTTRISLRKGRGENRIAKIYDSPDLPENEATFSITSGGVTDAKD